MEPTHAHPHEHSAEVQEHELRPRRRRDAHVEYLEERMRSLRDALRAVHQGDFSVRLPADGGTEGVFGEVALAFNALVARNAVLVHELGRVARGVAVEGRITERASLEAASGGWVSAVDSVNALVESIAFSSLETARLLEQVAAGDLSSEMPVHLDGHPLQGDFFKAAEALNCVIRQLRSVTSGVSRVVREIGTEGRLGVQARTEGLSGTWRDLVEDVNQLSGNLAAQVRNISLVSTAIANGDLSQKITVETRGEILELKNTINATVEQLRSFAAEVIRVAREVGTEGKLGGQADVRGVSGVWQELTDSVNRLAGNLTSQVRNISQIASAIAKGDLSQKITVEAKGEIFELKSTINSMVDRLKTFAAEVTRVAREVGTEGKLGGQADVGGVSGTWRGLTDSVNLMASNLTDQVRGIAKVVTAVANGDLSQKFVVEAKGEIASLADTINNMTDTLRTFADQVITVASEVGTDGKLGGQAKVPGVAGTWKDLTDNVNMLAGNLTNQVRNIALVTTAVANGDLSQKITVEARGEILQLKNTINTMVDQLRTFASEVTRVAKEVGTEGELGGQAQVPGVAGTWKDLTDNVNVMASNMTGQVRGIAKVVTAVADGDLSQMFVAEAKGEIASLADTINAMIDRLQTFAAEVTRVAREVGTEGQLGGQARVPGVSGTWKDLTDNVNLMASNLTDQVRGISLVVTAVAKGDLSKKLLFVAKGEIASLADTINDMTETLRTFADQVSTVAREVGIEGRLGGQAKVPGAAGTWRDLTDNVNQLAANLTSQVRAISEVATAVIQGDLTRSITVGAKGEVSGLKDTINQMIGNLRDTSRTNKEQDWLKTNLARFSGLMQGQRNLQSLTDQIMSELTPVVSAQHGAFYISERDGDEMTLRLTSTYAYARRKRLANRFGLGEGLVGQCALERKPIVVTEVPEDYVQVTSGLGEAPPRSIAVFPVLFENQVRGVIELGTFHEFTPVQLTFLEQLMLNVGLAINLIGTSMRTEQLLQQLQGSNVELDKRRKELEDRAGLLEMRNREIAEAGASLEAKSRELARVSQYKSQFLTNMSHEIRTPLNSMMILAQMLAANEGKNLTSRQQEWAGTIHSAGRDLLALINQILDLSKVEAGRIETHVETCPLDEVRVFAERMFRPVALQRGLEFAVDLAPSAPSAIKTDRQLLDQILKNLLANAFKFTERGRVDLRIELVTSGYRSESLRRAPAVVAFAVSDTGVGIPSEQQERIFEAFYQGDATITRRTGGAGLGLAISREYARVLGGEILVKSTPGRGSTFTLYLPLETESTLPPTPQRPTRTLGSEPTETEAKSPSQPTPEDSEAVAGKTILVVEDDARNLYALTSLLERHRMTVLPASNAQEALAQLERHPDTDIVLMDVMMPEVDGYEATRRIRAKKEFASLPVIALTAKASEADEIEAKNAGCAGYMVKPADARQLLAVLAQHVPRRP